MKLRNIFNIVLFSFIMIVILIPIKLKVNMVPLSADFILGGALIAIGFLCVIDMYLKQQQLFKPLNSIPLKILSIFIIMYAIISFLSTIYAPNRSAAVSEGIRFLEYVFIFYFIILIADEKTVDR